MKSKFYFFIIIGACAFYFAFRITGKQPLVIIAVCLIMVGIVYRLIYDGIHHSYPWTKTEEQKKKDELKRIEEAKKKEEKIKAKKLKKVAYMERMTHTDKKDEQ